MPVSSDPNQIVPFWLTCDAQKPLESRPVFECRAMTRRERRVVGELVQKAVAEKDDAKCYAMLVEALRIGVVGWRHMIDPVSREPIPFDLSRIENFCNDEEIWELAWGHPYAGSLTKADVGKFERPSDVPSTPSAATAPQAGVTSPLLSR